MKTDRLELCDICKSDFDEYLNMTKSFYSEGAAILDFDILVCERNFNAFLSGSDDIKCFIIKEDERVIGYVILSFMWCAELGGRAVFIEEIFIKEELRGKGTASDVINYIVDKYKDKVRRFRLEVCKSNLKAAKLYKKLGFDYLSYDQMILDI